jgi:hypothetical protein
MAVVGSTIALTLPSPDVAVYTPIGAVISNITSVESFEPKITFNYLASCSGVPLDEPNDCVVSAFTQHPFVQFLYGSLPSGFLPSFDDSAVIAAALQAGAACDQVEEVEGLIEAYKTIRSNSSCLESLNADEDVYLAIESSWLQTCANVSLPFPAPLEGESPILADDIQELSILTCMLDRAFETSPATFGLDAPPEGSPQACLVPGHADLAYNCQEIVGPSVYSSCKDLLTLEDEHISVDFVMSMGYSVPPTSNSGPDSADRGAEIVGEFCGILEKLNTERGQECLLELCNYSPMASSIISSSPSNAPSSSPSGFPSSTLPTSAPSFQRSAAPSTVLSLSPTNAPSGEPTPSPSLSPSGGPTPFPSGSPSVAPSISYAPSSISAQGQVKLSLFSSITLNVPPESLPANATERDALASVLEMAIDASVDGSSSSIVTFPPGARRLRRSLQQGEASSDFLVQLDSSRLCRVANCDAFAETALQEMQDGLAIVAENGTLTERIRAIATNEDVQVLESASVLDHQFLNKTYSVDEVGVSSDAEHLKVWFALAFSLAAMTVSTLI